MLNYRLTTDEQETVIRHTRSAKVATIYTSDRLVMSKLDQLCRDHPYVYSCIWVDNQILADGLPMSKKYAVDKKYVRPRKPLSEKARAAAAQNIRGHGFNSKAANDTEIGAQNEVEVKGSEVYD